MTKFEAGVVAQECKTAELGERLALVENILTTYEGQIQTITNDLSRLASDST
jgi:hypothetical protein